jgi:hypothetical protein
MGADFLKINDALRFLVLLRNINQRLVIKFIKSTFLLIKNYFKLMPAIQQLALLILISTLAREAQAGSAEVLLNGYDHTVPPFLNN